MAFNIDNLEYLHRSTEGGTSLAAYTTKSDGFVVGTGAGATDDNVVLQDGYWDTADVPLNGLIVFVVAKTDSATATTSLQQGTIRVNRLRQADPDSTDPDSTRVATLIAAATIATT